MMNNHADRLYRWSRALSELEEAAIRNPGDLAAFYSAAHEAARSVMSADACYVCLYEAATQQLSFEFNVDRDIHDGPTVCPIGSGPTSEAIRTGRTYVTGPEPGEIEEVSLRFGYIGDDTPSQIHALMGDRCSGERREPVGVFSIQSYATSAYDEYDVAFVELLARRVGAYIVANQLRTVAEGAMEAAGQVADAL